MFMPLHGRPNQNLRKPAHSAQSLPAGRQACPIISHNRGKQPTTNNQKPKTKNPKPAIPVFSVLSHFLPFRFNGNCSPHNGHFPYVCARKI
jgi:hypothetical protein